MAIEPEQQASVSVLDQPLVPCGREPMTGFYRDGCCNTGPGDRGSHTICAEMTADFLDYTRAQGNDLSTPRPELGFQGLRPGDCWCLCASRWLEAKRAGVAPPVHLARTHKAALKIVTLEQLLEHSADSAHLH
ncbi:MAG: DUF2237 domain-containing protein [Deltaproteobacteria bacterium]|jgi:uncharacterized protein (DUF2237 family)|nr:DUF2237 domain-containing protein [Deltaproteobacteria bacterium]